MPERSRLRPFRRLRDHIPLHRGPALYNHRSDTVVFSNRRGFAFRVHPRRQARVAMDGYYRLWSRRRILARFFLHHRRAGLRHGRVFHIDFNT